MQELIFIREREPTRSKFYIGLSTAEMKYSEWKREYDEWAQPRPMNYIRAFD